MPSTDEILERIELEPVVAAIRAEPIAHWSYEDAAKIVWNVANRFLPRDLETYREVHGIEQHWALQLIHSGGVQKFFDDEVAWVLEHQPSRQLIHGFTDLVMVREDGQHDVLDWKTASELDKAWNDRLADSWQWKLYLAVYEAQTFIYRGLDKSALAPRIPGQPYDWGKAPIKELRYQAPESNRRDVLNWIAGSMAMRDTLDARFPAGHWPRHMPDACRSFGQRCAHWDECRGKGEPTPGMFQTKAFSYSGITKFLNCPEHYRLATVTGHREPSPATELGNAVHRGTAALYAQFNQLRKDFYGDAAPDADVSKNG